MHGNHKHKEMTEPFLAAWFENKESTVISSAWSSGACVMKPVHLKDI